MLRLIAVLSVLLLSACVSRQDRAVPLSAATAGWDAFGAELAGADPVAVEAVLADPENFAGQRVLLDGVVESVCKQKGCWMTLAAGGRSVRVRFKDYGFFVPLDCEGRRVLAGGEFSLKKLDADETRHYLEDAGKHEEAARVLEGTVECLLIADGVRMAPRSGP